MKRTLLEILGALGVLVGFAAMHDQITSIRDQQSEVAELRGMVERTAALADARRELEAVRDELTGLVDSRLEALETRVAEAQQEAREASFLQAELERAREAAESMKEQIAADVHETRELVRSSYDELRQSDQSVQARTEQNGAVLAALTGRLRPDAHVLTRELLLPTVQLNGRDTVGSGTLVRSTHDRRTGRTENYVLTAWHVVRNIHADTPRSKREGVEVTIYGDTGDQSVVRGQLVAYKPDIDVAVLRLDTDRVFPNVARVLSATDAEHVRVWDEVFAIGCPLGNDPIPTRGVVASTRNVIDGTNYWMINAPTYYGNSGGGVYLLDGRTLCGVFSKIYTHGRTSPVVVPHMGLCTPMSTIRAWLAEEGLAHVIDDGQTSTAPTDVELDALAAPGR